MRMRANAHKADEEILQRESTELGTGNDDEVSITSTLATIDSACHPVHLPKPTNTMRQVHNVYTRTATRHRSLVNHQGPVNLRIGKAKIKIPSAVAVPSLTEPLLSVKQLTHKHDLHFTNKKVYITKQVQNPADIVAEGNESNGLYRQRTQIKEGRNPTPILNSVRTYVPRSRKLASANETNLHSYLIAVNTRGKTPASRKEIPTIATFKRVPKVKSMEAAPVQSNKVVEDYHHYHRLFNHVSVDTLHKMAEQNYPGLPRTLKRPHPPISFSGCAKGRMRRSPFQRSSKRTLPGESFASGTCTWDITSLNGFNHFATFLDESTRFLNIALLTHRKRVKDHTERVLLEIMVHTGNPIRTFRTDNAKEYTISQDIQNFLSSHGISLKPTTSHTPQGNARAERINLTLTERTRTRSHTAIYPDNVGVRTTRHCCKI